MILEGYVEELTRTLRSSAERRRSTRRPKVFVDVN